MREVFEFRILAADLKRIIGLTAVKYPTVGGDVSVVKLMRSDPVFKSLARAYLEKQSTLFFSWDVRRTYSASELAAAELVRLVPIGLFEPDGETCGTVYDYSAACPSCGSGRAQVTPLALDLRSRQPDHDIHTSVLRRGKDLAWSIAREVVVSERFTDFVHQQSATGAVFEVVNRCHSQHPIIGWRELVVTSPPVEVTYPTQYGIDPFDPDAEGLFRCPHGHVLGLNVISDLTIERGSWHGDDIIITRQLSGRRSGALVPAPEYLVSGRLCAVMRQQGIRGVRYEVAHLAG